MLYTCAQKEALFSADVEGGEGQEAEDGEAGPPVSSLFASLPCHPFSASPRTQDMFHCKCPCQSGHALNTWFSMCSPMDTLMHTCLDSRERPLVNTHVQSQKYLLILWVSFPSWGFLHSWQVKGVSALAPLLKLKLHRNSSVCSAFVHKDTTAIKTFGLLKTLGSWQRLFWLKVKKEDKSEFQVYIVSEQENIHTGASKFTTNP